MASAKGVVKADTVGCARCGEDHPQLEFRPLTQEITLISAPVQHIFKLTHFAMCPALDEPILMRFTDGD